MAECLGNGRKMKVKKMKRNVYDELEFNRRVCAGFAGSNLQTVANQWPVRSVKVTQSKKFMGR